MFFANCSRHPSSHWSRAQVREAAAIVGGAGIKDYEIPFVDPWATTTEVGAMATALRDQIIADGCTAAMVQGEYTLTIKLVTMLKISGVDCYIATLLPGFEEQDSGYKARSFCRFRLA
jgi:hypothetical protein